MSEPSARAGDLLLKVTAPRVPKGLLARHQLAVDGPALRDRAAVVVQAPPGFGKTSLLAQWRLEHLARGAAVAWVSAQPGDDVDRLVRCLALAVRVGAGRPAFGHVLLEGGAVEGLEGITLWLAEVAQSAFELVLVVDEADRLPAPAREAIGYLVRNAPPNLQCIVAARPEADLALDDLVSYGQCARIVAADLRFTLEETLRLAEQRLGPAFDRDRVARLHAQAEGWPLGLQLALTVDPSGRGSEPAALRAAALPEQFVALLLRGLDPGDLAFLVRVSPVQHLHPALCSALVPAADTPARLERLIRDTPVFVAGEQGWVRLHALARAALTPRFEALPPAERAQLHARACEWLAEQGLLEAAAHHALASGNQDLAYDFAERSLYESLMTRGHQAAVLEWVAGAAPEELARRPRLLLAAAWSLAISERHEQARGYVERILAQPGADDSLRCEAALILAAAAVFADDPDAFAALHDPWAERPPLASEALLQVHANRSAFRALLAGEPALARLRQQRGPHHFPAAGNLDRWGEYIVGLSYLWEGQPVMVDQLLAPCLASAEGDLGRRSAFACVVAAALAAARWERGLADDAVVLLADRLDVLERSGLPESVLLGFRTLARASRAAQGGEQRALALLGALDAAGIARGMPRLRLASLAEQVRLHAREFRSETCRELVRQMELLLEDPATPRGVLWRRSVEGLLQLARAHAAIAARDWRAALAPLERAEALASERKLGRDRIEAMALRAWVLDRSAERSLPLLQEVLTLAHAADLRAVLDDAHPQLAAWARHAAERSPQPAPTSPPAAPARPAGPRAAASAALTPKEREVLELLARNLSNKEIALAMQIGEETIKWHVKNLFAKLDAGTRKQVVGRARILGFLADGS